MCKHLKYKVSTEESLLFEDSVITTLDSFVYFEISDWLAGFHEVLMKK
jgi:hypothetical protein